MASVEKEPDRVPEGALSFPFEQLCNDGGGGKGVLFIVRFWRALVLPMLRQLLRLAMKSSVSTAHSMLLMRTYFSDYGLVHANHDTVAPLFRDDLMPDIAAMIKAGGIKGMLRGQMMILPVLGVPGIGLFVDVRTAWLDEAVEAALDGRGIAWSGGGEAEGGGGAGGGGGGTGRDEEGTPAPEGAAGGGAEGTAAPAEGQGAGPKAEQVVVIAAGFDTRAYRLSRPGVRFFEIDLPDSSASKRALVDRAVPDGKAHPRPVYIAANLSQVSLSEALLGTGFDASRPSVFLAEGLTYYLPPQAVRALFESVAALSAPGSHFCFDWLRLSVVSGRSFNPGFETLATAVSNRGEPFLSAIDDEDPDAIRRLAEAFGFRCTFSAGARDMARHYYGSRIPWRSFPATVTTCFRYAVFERAG